MSRVSGWSTAANTVPVGGAANADNTSPAEDILSVTDKLKAEVGVSSLFPSLPLDAASKHARKIYIGNLPPSATSEQVITQFFNQTLAALLPHKPPGDSIIGTYLNIQKRFAFIENRSIEETTFTLGLDGIQMDEYALKLRRPQDYNAQLAQQQLSQEMRLKGGISSLRGAWNPMHQAGVESTQTQQSGPGIVSTSVEDGPNKVFVGGLPHHMGEHEVKELLSSYGSLKAFHLVKDRELDRSKGFAFCEWRDPAVTDVACQSLNGMKVGDRFLNVRRAVPHSAHRGGHTMLSAGMGMEMPGGMPMALPYLPPIDPRPTPPIQKGVPPLELPDIASSLLKESAQGSRCLAVRRVVSTDREVNVEEVQGLVELVKGKASKVGKVRNAIFHHSEGGRILIEFSLPEEATAAQQVFEAEEICGKRPDCVLTEMIPEMRRVCLTRVLAEAEMLNRLDPEARKMYNESQKKMIDANRQKREKVLSSLSTSPP